MNRILDGVATQICAISVLSWYTSVNKRCRGNEWLSHKIIASGVGRWCHIPLWRESEGKLSRGHRWGCCSIYDTEFGREISVLPVCLCSMLQLKCVLRLRAWEEMGGKIRCSKKNCCKLALLCFPLRCLEMSNQSWAIWSLLASWGWCENLANQKSSSVPAESNENGACHGYWEGMSKLCIPEIYWVCTK